MRLFCSAKWIGWGAILRYTGQEKELSGGENPTTNNRMELSAVIGGLALLKEPCEVTLYTDSQYVANGLSKGWAVAWKRNGWRKADKSPALNPDLWERLLELTGYHTVTVVWGKGHAGPPEMSVVTGWPWLNPQGFSENAENGEFSSYFRAGY